MKIHPLDDRVVVKPLEAPDKTPGGILLPDVAKEKPLRGTIVATGPGRMLDSGQRCPLTLKDGDQVLYARYAGNDIEVEEEAVKILRESDILARLE